MMGGNTRLPTEMRMTTKTMSRMSRFIAWLDNVPCPRCGKKELIPKNPRYDRKFRCTNCGALGKVVRREK